MIFLKLDQVLVLELGYTERHFFPETDMNTTSYSFHMKVLESLKKKPNKQNPQNLKNNLEHKKHALWFETIWFVQEQVLRNWRKAFNY